MITWTTGPDGSRRHGDFEARPGVEKGVHVWKVFHRGAFVFSSTEPSAVRRFVAGRIETLNKNGAANGLPTDV